MAKKDLAPHFLLSVGQLPGRADHFLQTPVVVRMGIEQPVVAAGLYRLAIARSLFASESSWFFSTRTTWIIAVGS